MSSNRVKVAGAPIFTYTHEPDDNEFITDALLRAGRVM